MRVLHVAAECFPLAKSGGLADVTAALSSALRASGIDARLLLPGYPQAIARALDPRVVARLDGLLDCGEVRLLEAWAPDGDVPLWLLDCPRLYARDGGLYQDGEGREWPDNARRFALLGHAAAMLATGTAGIGWRPDVVHGHDWHAGLAPLLLSLGARPRPATVLTIHNLAYQGLFPAAAFGELGLPHDPGLFAQMEFYGSLSFLKAGIGSADALTTVSPTYAREIVTPEYGSGLDGLLRARADRLVGIMNGVDYRVWDPGTDPYLPRNFSAHHISGKRACKEAIQAELGLEAAADVPLVAFVSRLAHQKMPDIVLEAMPALLDLGIQFALVAEGDRGYEAQFRALAAENPGRVAARLGYEEPLAHRLIAGADILLHPARFEPCGLAPIYAMRYGAIPIVRRSGGMCDSVVDALATESHHELATGFAFTEPTADALIACVAQALPCYRQPILWRKMQLRAMRRDFGWEEPARAYGKLYGRLAPSAGSRGVADDDAGAAIGAWPREARGAVRMKEGAHDA